jgi:NADH-quinone oxidoreductase subunit N
LTSLPGTGGSIGAGGTRAKAETSETIMPIYPVPDLFPAIPEIFLAVSAMGLLLAGVFGGDNANRLVSWLGVAVLAGTAWLVFRVDSAAQTGFNGMFVIDPFAVFMKVLVLAGSAVTLIMSIGYNEREKIDRIEYPVLILLSTLGMLMMISANDLIALYLGLELQSLALYVVAAFRRDSVRSTEAGLKYFVLGALSSGMLLYGCSLIYGFSGTTSFEALAHTLTGAHAPLGLIIGIVFVAVGLSFKLAAVPFHMWTPDVYEGAPTAVTAFFAVAPKVAATALFVRFLMGPFGGIATEWRQIIWFVAVGSMLLGAFAAINQTNIKRLMAYSSISHVGYVLIGLTAGTEAGIRGVLIYMAIYVLMTLGTFAVILCMRRNGKEVETIADLSGLARTQPGLAFALALFMFSMAGIPPLAGFFSKLYVFLAAIDAGLNILAVIGVVSSVVAAYYYVRIVKLMYFDEPVEAFEPAGFEMRSIIAVTAAAVLFLLVGLNPLASSAEAAAKVFFPG